LTAQRNIDRLRRETLPVLTVTKSLKGDMGIISAFSERRTTLESLEKVSGNFPAGDV